MILYQCLIGLARDAEAVAVLREELDRQPGHPEIGLLLAWTLATSPDSSERGTLTSQTMARHL